MTDNRKEPLTTPLIVCGAVLQKDGKYLLVQEKKPEVYGKWNLPAGRVDQGETLEEAAIREVKEESGFDIAISKHLLVISKTADSPILHAFSARIIGGELRFPEHEILDARWFSYQEIMNMKHELRNPEYILGAIEQLDTHRLQ